ncbi:hypothetical protein [Neptuniibacter sp.]|uniref:hypothetical protein n=1 Tax=Neptuniibacter sp. TaxID=1962643 RepID=UPI00262E83D3|nr:hypothetical protein [Neptuniibacter sp.]MCP4597406.1 insulinase family protein [Neptuniibacter sp.]
MENQYRPFFSRKQINALMWFSLLAILILSSLGPKAVEYQNIEHNDAKNIYWMELDGQPLTLTMLLPARPALNENQRQLQQLKAQILQKRLRDNASPAYSFSVTPRQDRIELNLKWAAEQSLPDINNILTALQQPVETSRWQEALKTIEARDYLQNQATEQQIINKFFSSIQHESTPVLSQLAGSFNAQFQQIRYVISGDEADNYAEQLEELLTESTSQVAPLSTPTVAAQDINLTNPSDSQYRILTGGLIPPRNHEEFVAYRLAAQVLQDLFTEYKDQHGLDYRLLWGALNVTGYQAVLLSSKQHLQPLLPQLQQLITDDLVELSQNRLAYQWEERMRDNQNQVQAMNLIAYYDLSPDTLEEYIEQIQDQDIEKVIQLAKQALQTDQHINILLTPTH